MDKTILEAIDAAAEIWSRAVFPVALTGAGISVASGIPDFRSPGGLWSRFDPMEVATDKALRRNPLGVWQFLLEAVQVFVRAVPNPAHEALADLERAGCLQAIITQNIDSLHQRAGSRRVVEFHGHCRSFYCNSCRAAGDVGRVAKLTRADIPWTCDHCGGVIRPEVVFFGEAIPEQAMQEAEGLVARADLAIIVGTSGEVAPFSVFPYRIKAMGGRVIEINLGPTAYGRLPDVRIDAPAERVLPELARRILKPHAPAIT
ncbi:MAG: NAD-dependent deacylase [Desulfocurvibacter africanus]